MPNRADYRGALQTSPLASAMVAPRPRALSLPTDRDLQFITDASPSIFPPQVDLNIRPTDRDIQFILDSNSLPPAQEEGLVEKLGAMLRGIPSRVKQFQESNKERGELATHLGRLTGENPENFLHLSVEEMRLQLQAIDKAMEPPAITSQ